MASQTISTEISMRKTPLANPARVSMEERPYGKWSVGGCFEREDARRPRRRARQSKNIWMESEIRPRELVR